MINITGYCGIAGATISYSGTSTGSVISDSTGWYLIQGLPQGSYTITPTASGFEFVPASHNLVGIRAPLDVERADFQVAFTIAGLVTKGGVAQTGILVTCGSQAGLRETMTDASGNYSFTPFTDEGGVWTISAGGKSLTIILSVQAISGLPAQTYANANILS